MYLRNITTARFRKVAFIKSLPQGACVLDVGCGNNGPTRFKALRPDLYYVGIDVSDYNQTEKDYGAADEYIKCEPDSFAEQISELGQRFDAIVSSHNLEHCNNPQKTISAICKVLKVNGLLFLAFPSENTVRFPKRRGTLNFYDDPTHIWVPNWNEILKILDINGLEMLILKKNYRPIIHFVLGVVLEPVSIIMKRVFPGTWALWGFESVIWAKKSKNVALNADTRIE